MDKLRFDSSDYSCCEEQGIPAERVEVEDLSSREQSPIFFRTVVAANKAGKAALKQLLAKLN